MMKMRLTVMSLMALVAACSGPVRQVEESTTGQAVMTVAEKGAIEQAIGGGQCGSHVCSAGSYCCNASCGICAPKGGACPQIACDR